ncbi:uncharacterized protein [Primulina eburnea]|uniref:uncharacterized protein isoform X4 n=1 Tax=Primulina eburnea TaxID=1245227 RepID=UPI003C6C0CEF
MAFPRSHPPHSGWDKFHGLTKINTRAQLPLVNIQRNYSSKLVGTLESKCSEPEDFYVVSSKSASPVTQNWGDIYGVPWLLLVLSSLYWINQRWECNAHLWIVHHLRMERIVDAYFTSKCDFRYHCSRRCESLSFGTRLSFHAISIDIPWRIVRVSNG